MLRTIIVGAAAAIAVGSPAWADEARPIAQDMCAPASETEPPAFASPPEGYALVVIYRRGSGALALRRSLYFLNGVNVVKLWNGAYTALLVPEGVYTFAQRWPLDVSYGEKMETTMTWESGLTYFYEQNTDVSMSYNAMTFSTSVDGGRRLPRVRAGAKCVAPRNLDEVRPTIPDDVESERSV